MTHITLGHAERKPLHLDLPVLLRTRLLIQANSGGGKSWLLRRLAEQAFGKVQIVIIDPEGEYATLREKFDYVLVGTGGETPADVRSAALVAHKLLELKASAVCDLYEMKASDRHRWVRLFLDALLDAPKSLWHPLLVIVDEAHIFCPEKGKGESEASESMVGLCTRGRKRGFGAVWATQRLSKVNKDATSMLANRLIGPTFEDVDVERAADLLSVPNAAKREFFLEMRTLEPGRFYAFGRALAKERTLFTVGAVQTTHPDINDATITLAPPPAPDKIRKLLPSLAELPQVAETKARTEAEMRHEIAELKRQIAARPAAVLPEMRVERVEVSVFRDGEVKRLEAVAQTLAQVGSQLVTVGGQLAATAQEVSTQLRAVVAHQSAPVRTIAHQPAPARAAAAPTATPTAPGGALPVGEKAVLSAMAQYPKGVTREQLTVLTGYKRSSRDAYLQRLRNRGYIDDRGRIITALSDGYAALGDDFCPLHVGAELRQYWLARLPRGEREIFAVVVDNYPRAIPKAELETLTPYKRSSRDAYIQRLRARMLIEDERGVIRASETLFAE